MTPKEIAQTTAQSVFKDAEALHELKPLDWWRHLLSRWKLIRTDVEGLPFLSLDNRRVLGQAIDDVQTALSTYVEPRLASRQQVKEGATVRLELERLGTELAKLVGHGDWPPRARELPAVTFHGDPRLAEVEFLRTVEREGSARFHVLGNDPQTYFGLPAVAFRELLVDVLARGLLNGPASHPPGRPFQVAELEWLYRNAQEISDVMEEKSISVRLNHRGRVHLWQLRDDLLLARDREEFGILWNKKAWQRALPLHLQWASEETPLTVMLLDLDHFKRINDTYGHLKGDDVLRATFELIRDVVAGVGEAYRYGGEEIGVIAANTPFAKGRLLGDAIRTTIEKEVANAAGLPHPQTISVGVGGFTSPVGADVAFEFVDSLLYEVKRGTRNMVRAEVYAENRK